MKKLLTIVFGVALMGLCSLVNAQNQDTASTNISGQPAVEQGDDTQSDDAKTQEAERLQSTDDQLQNDADEMKENFEGATIDKVGPNGEKLFMERGKYYYMNDEGKKVKVKKSEVRDKSKDGVQ
ncbi:hypothetical protein [Chryseolinea sp. H1M3-3]|uniref:hypothetical protein n=1 Tax=Chryseolinea sp. H1M3-3 TaxID=3034144 RepID=UPI0023ED61C8|nr:hypothetical protein [Chryseolinea sp. H1M3-3]